MPGGVAGLQNQSESRKVLGGFDSLPSPPAPRPRSGRHLGSNCKVALHTTAISLYFSDSDWWLAAFSMPLLVQITGNGREAIARRSFEQIADLVIARLRKI